MTRGILNDLTGIRFGRLIVLLRAQSDKGNNARWSCECDCGNRVFILGQSLRSGQKYCSRQCRLLKEEVLERDISGETFARLTALNKTTKRGRDDRTVWRFKCWCGEIIERRALDVVTGRIKSCGCLRDLCGGKLNPNALRWNREYHREHHRKWAARNPDKVAENVRRRRGALQGNSPKWLTSEERAEIRAKYIEARALTTTTGIKHHVDHIIPLRGKQVRGLHVPWNLQVVTATYNHRKSRKLLDDVC